MTDKTSPSPRPFLWMPLAVLAAISIASWLTSLDMWIARLFYGGDGTWTYADARLWRMLYDVGPLLGIVIGAGSFFGFIGGFFLRKLRPWRMPMIYLALAAFVGPALVVNFIFKDHYGRPRPRDVVEFGGQQHYLDVWMPGSEYGHSFPSGHSSIAFYVMTPYFVLLAWRRKLAYGFLLGGLAFGLLLGLTRMVQGAHFMTDILWAGGMVYLVDYGLYYLLRLHRWRPPVPELAERPQPRAVRVRPVAAGTGTFSSRSGLVRRADP